MAQRRVSVPVDDELVWLLDAPELTPCHTRRATAEALRELETRYLPDAAAGGDEALTWRVAGIVAGLIAARELRGPWGD